MNLNEQCESFARRAMRHAAYLVTGRDMTMLAGGSYWAAKVRAEEAAVVTSDLQPCAS